MLTLRIASWALAGALVLTVTLGTTAGLRASPAQAQEQTGGSITTIGEGAAAAPPDRARLALVVEATDPSIGAAQTRVGRQVTAVRQALVTRGVAPGDIRTGHFTVGPRYERKDPQPNISGYVATYGLEVETSDLQGLGPLLDTALEHGVTRVDGIQFHVGDPQALLASARSAALKDAREKAEQIARESGMGLRGMVRVEEVDGQVSPSSRFEVMPGPHRLRSVLRVSWSTQ